ncbi:insulinase family protein [Cyanobium sp. ATX 6A2]|uniref:M16 family metallopeptidase n=1 Tax=Cyanobium sp. ATX 6A2 TaxID=2823700 RepID=UPI0020CC7F63|nr:pitrilysin family protein [Cyanobium sp. ATX 6A2]MCP9887138.1 insulinase family protein [Cyanobium sp. ATX 6A2]
MTLTATQPGAWTTRTLLGGLPLVLQRRPAAGLVAGRLWIRGGSSLDPAGQRGAMQLLAGSMTRGAGRLDAEALADLVEGCGAALRAEASEDALVISLKCASDDAPELLPLLLAMVTEPCLLPEQVGLERQLNLQHLQRQREDPFQLAHDGLRALLYGNGPYGHDPLGLEEDLAQIGSRDLEKLVGGLSASGALLVLCGDLDDHFEEPLNAALRRRPWSTQAPRPQPWSAAARCSPLTLQEQDTEQLVIMLGAATVPLGHGDALALRLLQTHLGVGMSSRLFQVMREQRGLAYDVGVHMPARCAASPFVFHLSTSAARAREACAALLEEWQRLASEPLSDADLQLARAKFRGQDAMGRQTCGQVADRQALVLGHGLAESHVQDCLERAEQIGPDALQDAAQRWLSQPALSLCGPAEALVAAERAWQAADGSAS